MTSVVSVAFTSNFALSSFWYYRRQTIKHWASGGVRISYKEHYWFKYHYREHAYDQMGVGVGLWARVTSNNTVVQPAIPTRTFSTLIRNLFSSAADPETLINEEICVCCTCLEVYCILSGTVQKETTFPGWSLRKNRDAWSCTCCASRHSFVRGRAS